MNGTEKDHDILIKVATNLEALCKDIKKVDRENKEEHKEIKAMIRDNAQVATETKETVAKESKEQIEKCHSKFLHTRVFLWVAGFMIAGIIGAYSFTSIVQADLKKHQIQDAKIMSDFMNHLEKFNIHVDNEGVKKQVNK
jgi:hypothetical protein